MSADAKNDLATTGLSVETIFSIEGPRADRLWRVYDDVFRDANNRAPSRQSYHHEEFLSVAADPEVVKIIVTDDEGKVKGLAICTFDFSKMSWVSPEYFHRRFPPLRGRLMYIPAILIVPGERGAGVGAALMREIQREMRDSGGLGIAFDHSANLNPHLVDIIAWSTGSKFLPPLDSQVFRVALDTQGSHWASIGESERQQLTETMESTGDRSTAIFSPADLVHQCLIDDERVGAFGDAIEALVHPGMAVLDVGTGTGILAMLAARAGAEKVLAIESDPTLVRMAREIVLANGFEQTIEIVAGDARVYDFSGFRPHVVICELLSTGCVDEHQVPVMNHLRRTGLITDQTIVIPERLRTAATLAFSSRSLYGFEFPIVRHVWKQYPERSPVTAKSRPKTFQDLDFSHSPPAETDECLNFQIDGEGPVNSLIMESTAMLSERITLSDTVSFLPPVIVPLKQRDFSPGDFASVQVKYAAGGGYGSFSVRWV